MNTSCNPTESQKYPHPDPTNQFSAWFFTLPVGGIFFTECESPPKWGDFIPHHQSHHPWWCNSSVYKFECSCGEKLYVGETLRRLAIRITEHQRKTTAKNPQKSAIYWHCQSCPHAKGEVKKDNFKIIERGLRHTEARRAYETIMINHYEGRAELSTMNENTSSRKLALFCSGCNRN